jgi:hypothetical protein
MARFDRHQPESGEPRPNTLAEGNPVPNVLRGTVEPSSADRPGRSPAREAALDERRWRRRSPRDRTGSARVEPGRTDREPSGQQGGRRASVPGCGCGGWAVVIGFLFVVMRLVGACDDLTTPAGTVPTVDQPVSSTVSWHELEPGDCFDWPADGQAISDVTLRDCSGTHDVEVVGMAELPDPPGAAYEENAVTAAARLGCDGVYSAYTGQRALASTGSDPEVLYPGSAAWAADERTVVCVAEGEGPGALVGSVRAGP